MILLIRHFEGRGTYEVLSLVRETINTTCADNNGAKSYIHTVHEEQLFTGSEADCKAYAFAKQEDALKTRSATKEAINEAIKLTNVLIKNI